MNNQKLRVFAANEVNLNRIGFALYELAQEAEAEPLIFRKDNVIYLQRQDKPCVRVFMHNEGYWMVQREAEKFGGTYWKEHEAMGVATSRYAKLYLSKPCLSIGIARSNAAVAKHVFMGLFGLKQQFVVVGKKENILNGIAEGIAKAEEYTKQA